MNGKLRNKGLNAKAYNSFRITTAQSEKKIFCENIKYENASNLAIKPEETNRKLIESIFRSNGASSLNQSFALNQDVAEIDVTKYKTELCLNWMTLGKCPYGNRCNFGHGVNDLRANRRVRNYKTQMCCDPARQGGHSCAFGAKCNFLHPGEALRKNFSKSYFENEYVSELEAIFGDNETPFGVYI
ncbi:hypothetical protein MHBO_001781 [Bonamia ostreae]|uniref:C3H1-type domain-containing protein n=1 Tax=Bonamia ostreae TaxID=126728 RepID=A0ABV2AK52_9EUKA